MRDDLFLGFDDVFNSVGFFDKSKKNTSDANYPTDIWTEDNKTFVQMAIAGFSKDNIHVSFDERKKILTVKGLKSEKNNCSKPKHYIQRICRKSFQQSFILADNAEVNSVEMKDGLLTVLIQSRQLPSVVKQIEVK